jgi:hypothetical protein
MPTHRDEPWNRDKLKRQADAQHPAKKPQQSTPTKAEALRLRSEDELRRTTSKPPPGSC